MFEISNCPSTLVGGYSSYSPQAISDLWDGKQVSPLLDFKFSGRSYSTELANAMQRMSMSGVQEKFPAVIDDGKIRIARAGERSVYILKPAPWDVTLISRKQIPANEHLTMQIASHVYGIVVAANGLCFTRDGQAVFVTKRFDIVSGGEKLLMEDFASLLGRNEVTEGSVFKYNGSYADIASCIRRYISAWKVDLERFFDLVVFNYIYGNGDAHLKNFSIVRQGSEYRLSPAYDLLNTSLHINGSDFALDGGLSASFEKSEVYVQTEHPCRADFDRFGELIGLEKKRVKNILDKYIQLPDSVRMLIGNSYLNEKMKRSYLRAVEERIKRFVRVSGDF